MTIARVERIALREVWKHEAYDFTHWLQENIDVLNEALGLNLSSPEREQAAGSFSVDLVAEDESGSPVVIENQLERSNHDHLGKLITYSVALDARTAVWIVADPRPEHIGAVNWLNESSSADFYLVKLEAIRVGESLPAPLLTLITGPSAEGREVGQTKKHIAERYTIRREFWTTLLDRARSETKLHANISPGREGWASTTAGRRGCSLAYVIRQHDGQVELYIDRGPDAAEENIRMFDALAEHRREIEVQVGEPLDWQRLDGRRACRIRKVVAKGGYRDRERWPEIQDAMIDSMIKLAGALKPHISKLDI